MFRKLVLTASLLTAGAWVLAPAPAYACGGEGGACNCQQGKDHAHDAKAGAPAVKKKPAPKSDAKKGGEAQPAPAEKQGAVQKTFEDLLAGKCACSSAADCTCKKGACQCPKCGGHRRQIIAPLSGAVRVTPAAVSERHDATAGVFL